MAHDEPLLAVVPLVSTVPRPGQVEASKLWFVPHEHEVWLTSWRGVWDRFIDFSSDVYEAEATFPAYADFYSGTETLRVLFPKKARLLRKVKEPQWWTDAKSLVNELVPRLFMARTRQFPDRSDVVIIGFDDEYAIIQEDEDCCGGRVHMRAFLGKEIELALVSGACLEISREVDARVNAHKSEFSGRVLEAMAEYTANHIICETVLRDVLGTQHLVRQFYQTAWLLLLHGFRVVSIRGDKYFVMPYI